MVLDLFMHIHSQYMSPHLNVVLRVPVRVVDDDSVCCCEVDTETSCPGTEQEDKPVRVWSEEEEGGAEGRGKEK